MVRQRNKPRRTKILIDRELSKMYELIAQGYTDRDDKGAKDERTNVLLVQEQAI